MKAKLTPVLPGLHAKLNGTCRIVQVVLQNDHFDEIVEGFRKVLHEAKLPRNQVTPVQSLASVGRRGESRPSGTAILSVRLAMGEGQGRDSLLVVRLAMGAGRRLENPERVCRRFHLRMPRKLKILLRVQLSRQQRLCLHGG